MGNRAVITTKSNFKHNGIGVYLHWNGGRDSVEAFLKYCALKGYRSPETDCYGWARLCQVIGNFFGGDTALGIDTLDHLDCANGDNGVYFIENWKIVGRKYQVGPEQHEYDLIDMLHEIDGTQPEKLDSFLWETVQQDCLARQARLICDEDLERVLLCGLNTEELKLLYLIELTRDRLFSNLNELRDALSERGVDVHDLTTTDWRWNYQALSDFGKCLMAEYFPQYKPDEQIHFLKECIQRWIAQGETSLNCKEDASLKELYRTFVLGAGLTSYYRIHIAPYLD